MKCIEYILFVCCDFRAAAAALAAQTGTGRSSRKIAPPLLRSKTLPAIITPASVVCKVAKKGLLIGKLHTGIHSMLCNKLNIIIYRMHIAHVVDQVIYRPMLFIFPLSFYHNIVYNMSLFFPSFLINSSNCEFARFHKILIEIV